MNGEDRKLSISMCACREFAKKGFSGTTMRDIAKAANVSEALIYQHFPSKANLYEDIFFYIGPQIDALCEYLKQYEPSTETLVKIVYSLSLMILTEMPGRSEDQKVFERLLVYSLLENPGFAKRVFKKYEEELGPIWNKSIEASYEAGDMYKPLVNPEKKMWFTHHLAMSINLLHIQEDKLFNYKGNLEELIESMVVFVLRGTGLSNEAVLKYAHSEILKKIAEKIFGPSADFFLMEE